MKYRPEKLKKANRAIARVESCTISVDHAVKVAQSIGGTVFDVKLKEVDMQVVWRVKILRNREQLKVYVHGNTGDLLGVKAEATAAESNPKISPDILPTPSLAN
jgi:uncharacterized membrane protein YkoI